MKDLWAKFKNLMARAWDGLTVAGRVIAALLLGGLIALGVYAIRDKKDADKTPEVSQIYEPSIGEPLPPDVNQDANPDQVSVSATVPEDKSKKSEVPVAPASPPPLAINSPTLIAPKTGVDTTPMTYQPNRLQRPR